MRLCSSFEGAVALYDDSCVSDFRFASLSDFLGPVGIRPCGEGFAPCQGKHGCSSSFFS